MSKFELMDGKKQLSRREAIQFNKTGEVPAREVPTGKMAHGFNGFGRYGGKNTMLKETFGTKLVKSVLNAIGLAR